MTHIETRSLRPALVTADGAHVYPALVAADVPSGHVAPKFTLAAVEDIAADLRADYTQSGYEHASDLRILRAPGLVEYRRQDDIEPEPVVVVVEVNWEHRLRNEPQDYTWVLNPDDEGRYRVGQAGWSWSEVDVQWGIFIGWFTDAALREALLIGGNPDGSGVGALRPRDVQGTTAGAISDAVQREKWRRLCRNFVARHRALLATANAHEAGQWFARSAHGSITTGFAASDLFERARAELHAAAEAVLLPEAHLRSGSVRLRFAD